MTHCTGAPFASTKPGLNQCMALAGHRGCEKGNPPPGPAGPGRGSPAAELLSQPCGKAQTELCNSRRTLGVAPSSSDLGVAVHFYKASVAVLFTLKHQED